MNWLDSDRRLSWRSERISEDIYEEEEDCPDSKLGFSDVASAAMFGRILTEFEQRWEIR